jgi:hypothetical protein
MGWSDKCSAPVTRMKIVTNVDEVPKTPGPLFEIIHESIMHQN